jgi:1-acyl-sn-glycerol-3-phosphate acyltransferase
MEDVLVEDDFVDEVARRRVETEGRGPDPEAFGVGACERGMKWARGVSKIMLALVEGRLRGAGDDVAQGARQLSGLCRELAQGLGVEVVVDGRVPADGLVVANHLGFLDVVAMAAAGPCVFVAKREVSGWLLAGAMARQCGTVFVDRERRSGVVAASAGIRRVLEAGVRVVLFPEGTSSEGGRVLPFKSSLLQAAVDARATVTPCGIFYRDSYGKPLRDVTYSGDRSLGESLGALIARRITRVHLAFGSPLRAEIPRSELSADLHQRVSRLIETGGLKRG